MSTAYDFGQLDAPAAPRRGGGGPSADEVGRALEAARAEGYAAGRQDGTAEAEGVLAEAHDALRGAAAALIAEREALADATERGAVELGLRIAEKAVAAAVAASPERVLEAVRGALRLLMERERFTVLVNPDDLDIVREGLSAVVAELGGVEHFEVQSERRVTRGGAVVRTVEGEVDATLEAKLQRAREVLEDELSGR